MLLGNDQSVGILEPRILPALTEAMRGLLFPCACGHWLCIGQKECRKTPVARTERKKFRPWRAFHMTSLGLTGRASVAAQTAQTAAEVRAPARPEVHARFMAVAIPAAQGAYAGAVPLSPQALRDTVAFPPDMSSVREKLAGENWGAHIKAFAAGMGTGFAVKIGFMMAATALTVPAALAAPVTVVASSVISNIVRTWVVSRAKGEKLEQGWMKTAALQGLIFGVGGSIGISVAAHAAAHFIPPDTLAHVSHHLTSFLKGHLLPSHAAHHVASALPLAPVVPAADTLAGIMHSSAFNHLSPHMQALGREVMASHATSAEQLHFYKEASYQLLRDGHTHAGATLVKLGADTARQYHLHGINASMLLRDEAYLHKMGEGFQSSLPHAQGASFAPPKLVDTSLRVPLPLHLENFPRGFGHISSHFGWRTNSITGLREFHSGVDMPAHEWTPVHAAMGGWTEAAGKASGWGNRVVIDSGHGVETLYAHMKQVVPLEPGSYVKPDQVIGYVGHTGLARGNHLHFGLYENHRPVDPLANYARNGQKLAQLVFE